MTEMLVSFRIVDWHASWEDLETALDAFAATNGVEIDCIGVSGEL